METTKQTPPPARPAARKAVSQAMAGAQVPQVKAPPRRKPAATTSPQAAIDSLDLLTGHVDQETFQLVVRVLHTVTNTLRGEIDGLKQMVWQIGQGQQAMSADMQMLIDHSVPEVLQNQAPTAPAPAQFGPAWSGGQGTATANVTKLKDALARAGEGLPPEGGPLKAAAAERLY